MLFLDEGKIVLDSRMDQLPDLFKEGEGVIVGGYLKENKCIPSIFQSYLSNNGIVLMPNIIKKNHIKFRIWASKVVVGSSVQELYKMKESSRLL